MTEFRAENNEQMKYLLGELSENEREAVEEQMFADEDFFAELLELENDLTDAYVRRELSENDRRRFEKSLDKFPERREKIANAAALREFIGSETNPAKVEKEQVVSHGFWERLRAFFAANSFAVQSAFAGLFILLSLGTGYLLYERFQLNQQLAELKNKRDLQMQKKEVELQNQLDEIRQRERNLQEQLTENQTKLDNRQEETENLRQEIENQQAERQRLEKELEDVRQNPGSPKDKTAPPKTVFASILLTSVSGGKGGDEVKYLEIGKDVSNIRLTLQIPPENSSKRFSVSLNGANVLSNVNLRNGKTLIVSISVGKFKMGNENRVTVKGVGGESFDYYLVVERKN